MIKLPQHTMDEVLPDYGNMNLYEFLLACLYPHKEDYPMFQFKMTDHMKSEFFEDVEAMAVYFKEELGLKPGDAYSLFIPNSIEEVVCLFALNKIGCIANLIHPLFPSEAMKRSVEYTKSKGILMYDMFIHQHAATLATMENLDILITTPVLYAAPVVKKDYVRPDEKALAVAAANNITVKYFGDIIKKYRGQKTEGLFRSGDNVAVYMNGGGTTGVSRFIMLSSTALNAVTKNALNAATLATDYKPGELAKVIPLPFFHCYGLIAGLLTTMISGWKSIPMARFDADEYISYFKANKCYEVVGVPNMFRKLLDHPGFAGEHLKCVKYAFAGGDYVPLDFHKRFNDIMAANGSECILMPGYGLTECGAVNCINMPWLTKPGTVGKYLKTTRAAIFDEEQNELPFGTVGEIAFTGNTLMKGYLQPDGRLGEGLYTDKNGKQWVLTGDLGKMDEDGYITFVARKKRVIIISGYNVYPADIENLLEPLPFLTECCAVQGYDEDKKPIVRLYIVLSPSADADKLEEYKKTICDMCATLDGFAVPRDIRVIDALPRTRLEKVDFVKLTEVRTEEHKT
ncbi:MAG: acyl--CoA ligase [Clostridia bacterium]|nr:acyl--CoA ligase [Clostridia bacterium]